MASYTQGTPSKRVDFVDPGTGYMVACIGATEGTSGAGNAKIELKLEVVGKDGRLYEPETGPVFYDTLTFTANAAWKVDQFRAAIGEEIVPGEEVEVIADELIGADFLADLKTEVYEGKTRNKVAAFIAAPEDADGGEDF